LDTAFLFGVQKNAEFSVKDYEQEKNNSKTFLNYIEQELFLKILRKHGSDKILFATDSPWSDAKAGIEYITKLPISEEVKIQILGENAKQLLKIDNH